MKKVKGVENTSVHTYIHTLSSRKFQNCINARKEGWKCTWSKFPFLLHAFQVKIKRDGQEANQLLFFWRLVETRPDQLLHLMLEYHYNKQYICLLRHCCQLPIALYLVVVVEQRKRNTRSSTFTFPFIQFPTRCIYFNKSEVYIMTSPLAARCFFFHWQRDRSLSLSPFPSLLCASRVEVFVLPIHFVESLSHLCYCCFLHSRTNM